MLGYYMLICIDQLVFKSLAIDMRSMVTDDVMQPVVSRIRQFLDTAMEINIRRPTNYFITPRLGGLKRRNFHQLWEII